MEEAFVFEEQFVQIEQCEICYIEQTSGQPASGDEAREPRTTVVYVHGNNASYKWFTRSMEVPGLRTIALDLPNFGRSGRIDSFEMSTYGEYVSAFIEEVAGGPVVLVGHSLGGAVAMSVACTRPELVDRLMLVNSSPVEGLFTPPERYPFLEALRANEDQYRAALRATAPTLSDDAWFDELFADAYRMNDGAVIGHAETLANADFREQASNYHGPVVVVRGEQDMLITEEMSKRTADAFNGRLRQLPGVGHSVMAEDPQLFISVLVEFIGQD